MVRPFDLNEGAPGQAAAAGQFVLRPAARSPAAPAPDAGGVVRVGSGRVGREDRHPTIRGCRPLSCLLQVTAASAGAEVGPAVCGHHPSSPTEVAGSGAPAPKAGGPVLYCARAAHRAGSPCRRRLPGPPHWRSWPGMHSDALPATCALRICQCRERGCRWHPRHRGCAGPVLLVLTREHGGRIRRPAYACAACAGATPHAAVVPDTVLCASPTQHLHDVIPTAAHDGPDGRAAPAEPARVRHMLSYLPRSPAGSPPVRPAL
jgi:hypothetical protein